MLNKDDVSALVKQTKETKHVSWNDKESTGKILEGFVREFEAASSSAEVVDDEVASLLEEGYSEEGACSLAGKLTTSTGKELNRNPIFYDSKETIDQAKQDRDARHQFFFKAGIGSALLVAAVAVIGAFGRSSRGS